GLGGEPWSADTEDEQPAYWLVRYMAGLYTHNEEKIVLEYREPAPEGELTPELLDGFRRRALAAFTVGGPASTDNVRAGYPDGVRWRYVDDSLLGPVMPKEIID
ncbi:MAG: DUF4851 domain-containing protein, partial [Desulfovibrionaceae bacterium]|nr:DUF4851 domain-containing protein [Desulfovibrionaceae bacterium]